MLKHEIDRIKGTFTLSSMTYHENGDVDYSAFERLVGHLSRTGAEGVGLYGMVSEFHKLTDYEKTALTSIFLGVMKGSPSASLLSVTDWSTDVAVRKAREYERLGADTLMLLPPFYFAPALDEVRHHMTSVLEAVDIPVVIQYAPQATGHFLPMEELVDMAVRYPNVAFKIEYKPARDFLQQFLALKPDMKILTGYAGLEMIDLYRIGVSGVMPACSYTEIYVAVHDAIVAGDMAKAQALYDMLEPYLVKWMKTPESLLAIEKEILVRRGIVGCSYCRRPAYHLTGEDRRDIDRFLSDFSAWLP